MSASKDRLTKTTCNAVKEGDHIVTRRTAPAVKKPLASVSVLPTDTKAIDGARNLDVLQTGTVPGGPDFAPSGAAYAAANLGGYTQAWSSHQTVTNEFIGLHSDDEVEYESRELEFNQVLPNHGTPKRKIKKHAPMSAKQQEGKSS